MRWGHVRASEQKENNGPAWFNRDVLEALCEYTEKNNRATDMVLQPIYHWPIIDTGVIARKKKIPLTSKISSQFTTKHAHTSQYLNNSKSYHTIKKNSNRKEFITYLNGTISQFFIYIKKSNRNVFI